MWRNIIWDVDGTLFDTYPSFVRAFSGSLSDLGLVEDEVELYRLAKISVEHCTLELSSRFTVTTDAIAEGFQRHYANLTAADQTPFPGLTSILQHIVDHGGKNAIVTHRRLASTQELLSVHGLEQYFSGAVTGDDGFPRKPDPVAFLAALERFDLDAAETLNIGDREIDIQAGQAAGLFSCLFAPQPSAHTAADLVISNYEQLLQTQFTKARAQRS